MGRPRGSKNAPKKDVNKKKQVEKKIQEANSHQLQMLRDKKENLEKNSKCEIKNGKSSPTKEELLERLHDLEKQLALSKVPQEPPLKKRKIFDSDSDDDDFENAKVNENDNDPPNDELNDSTKTEVAVVQIKEEDEKKELEGTGGTDEKETGTGTTGTGTTETETTRTGTMGTGITTGTSAVAKHELSSLVVSTSSNKQLFGKNYPHAEMTSIGNDIWCKVSVFQAMMACSKGPTHVVRRLVDGVFTDYAVMHATPTGQVSRTTTKKGDGLVLNIEAKEAIIKYAHKMSEEKKWVKKEDRQLVTSIGQRLVERRRQLLSMQNPEQGKDDA